MFDAIAMRALGRYVTDCVESGDANGLFAGYASGGKIWHNTDGEQGPNDADGGRGEVGGIQTS